MKLNIVLAFQALASFAVATTLPAIEPAVKADWDTIVVGGGPSGLAAASALGRVRRNVLLIDSGEYRNNPTRRIHDVLGFDGVTPAYFRWRARQQIIEYSTVTLKNGTVEKIEAVGTTNVTLFKVTTRFGDDGKETSLTARKIVLATGLRDLIPSTPGLAENFGKGIYWCPWCDGHEHVDQPMGVLGPLSLSATTPLEILTLNTDIIIFANGTDTPENRAINDPKLAAWDEWLEIHKITIDNRTITSIQRLKDAGSLNEDPSRATLPEHDLFQVNFNTGDPVQRAVFITNFEKEQKTKIGVNLGVKLIENKMIADFAKGMITNVPGVYAVGDANTDNSTNVYHAMWSGKRASVSLHVALETENAKSQTGRLPKRDVEIRERSIWEQVNGPNDVLDAGEFDR
ncbi:putative thioredoxin reductase [Pseudocercospora fuligena]|uniref:Putative thioredoxin reductase n=1 Tax=Pseudocercospora fuligena TaxID=685502 RepID=A0A8H6RSZ8_9PEZI|nr:putative thioredoxin reductase [Pseudocercospora fuligena]